MNTYTTTLGTDGETKPPDRRNMRAKVNARVASKLAAFTECMRAVKVQVQGPSNMVHSKRPCAEGFGCGYLSQPFLADGSDRAPS
jgi:hypothetical protein